MGHHASMLKIEHRKASCVGLLTPVHAPLVQERDLRSHIQGSSGGLSALRTLASNHHYSHYNFLERPFFSHNSIFTMEIREEDYLCVPHVTVERAALRGRLKTIHRRTLEAHLSVLKAHIDAGRSVNCHFLA